MPEMILVHMNKPEVEMLNKLQNGEIIDPDTGFRTYPTLEELIKNPKFIDFFNKAYSVLKKEPAEKVKAFTNEIKDKLTPPKKIAADKKGFAEKMQKLGKKDDKYLVFLPKGFLMFLIKTKGDYSVNKRTGFLEFAKDDEGGIWGSIAPQLGLTLLGSGVAGWFNYQGQKAQTKAMKQIAAEERAWKEDMMRRLGYFDPLVVDNRPSRMMRNPHFNENTIGQVPAFLGKEYYDPKTGKSVSSEEATRLKQERDKADPAGKDKLAFAYTPTPGEYKNISEHLNANALAQNEIRDQIANTPQMDLIRGKINIKKPNLLERSEKNILLDRERNRLEKKYNRRRHLSENNMELQQFAGGGMIAKIAKSEGIKGAGDGQSDSIKTTMPSGTWIVDATTTAHLGNGSSSAGIENLDKFIKTTRSQIGKKKFSSLANEVKQQVQPVKVAVARDEYKISPVDVAILGNGDLSQGNQALSMMVQNVRKHKSENGLDLPPKALPIQNYF